MSYFDFSATCTQFDPWYNSLQIAKMRFQINWSNVLRHVLSITVKISLILSNTCICRLSPKCPHVPRHFSRLMHILPNNHIGSHGDLCKDIVMAIFLGKHKLAGSAFETSICSSFEAQHTVGPAVNSPIYHPYHIALQWLTTKINQTLNWQTTTHFPSSWMLYILNILFRWLGVF